jgi:diacylglycerol kinase (ATP)
LTTDTARSKAPGAPARWARALVIWNANAGTKGGIRTNSTDEAGLRALLEPHGLRNAIVASGSDDAARRLTRDAVRDGCDLVVAAGGDGTIAVVADELIGTRTALGALPLGSVMNIVRMLGLPRDVEGAAEVLSNGVVRTVDVGRARGRPFYEAGSVGLNAAIFREAQRIDSGDWLSIGRAFWVAFRYRPARMTIELDDETIRTRALMTTVSNGPYTGAGLTVAPDATLDDGLFDVRVWRHFSKAELLRHFVSIAFGRRAYSPHVWTYRSARVRVHGARSLPCRADSRDLGVTPIEFVVQPRALRVLVPVDWGGGPAPAPSPKQD